MSHDARAADAGVRTRHRETVRTGRYHLAGAEPADARHFCFVLHGYGQLASRALREFDGVVPDGMCVVAPEALSRFYLEAPTRDGSHLRHVGASWLTRDDREHEISDAMRWLDGVHDEVLAEAGRGNAATTSVLGFSQGVATAMRWIMLGRVRPTHFVVWAGGLASDMDQREFAERMECATLLLVAGNADEFATPAEISVIRAHLDELGVANEFVGFEGAHRLDATTLQSLLPRLGSPGIA